MRTCFTCMLGLVLTPALAPAEEVLIITKDGSPTATIVIPADPNAGEKRAADELQAYVEKVSGARLPIAADSDNVAGTKIFLGRACTNLKNRPTGDGFTIETSDGAISIAGGNQRGTLFGVYALLEDQLGIRWYTPDDIGEVLRKRKTIRIAPVDTSEQPDFEYRWIGRGDDWSARTRNNVALPEIGVNIFRSAHTFAVFLDPRKYFDAHPDWFGLVRGTRLRNERLSHGNQICTSNPEAVEEVIRNMRKFLDDNPETDIITLFPNDGTGFCECAGCKALDEPGWASVEDINLYARGMGLAGYGAISRRLMIFNNTVARAIGRSHPGVLVKVGAYSCYTSPPKDPSLVHADNIIVQICHSWCQNHAITDPECEVNADFKRSIEGWSRITPGGVMLYEYYYKVAQCELPYPIIHAMREDIPYFKSIGVKGVYTQYSGNWGTLTLPYYVAARLLWDAGADVDRLTDEFYRDFYGAAAGPMKQYYERLERAAVESGHHFSPPYYRFPEVFTAECLADCRRHLEEARRQTDVSLIGRRLAMVDTSLTYTEMVIDYVNSVRAAEGPAASIRWYVDRDPDVFATADQKAEAVRSFMAEPQTRNVLRQNSTYVNRLLSPGYTFQFRWARTDPRTAQQQNEIALTRPEWLASREPTELGPRPKTFDLWIYGNDFDGGGDNAEHELAFLDRSGDRLAVLPMPLKGQACNRATGCLVYQNVAWPEPTSDVLRLEIVKRPNNWTGSTLLAVYVMPGGGNVSLKKAAELIRTNPEQPRAESIGFTELGYRGLTNSEQKPTRIDVKLPGPPQSAKH